MSGITKPALLVMAFAPVDSEIDSHSRQYLECTWRACRALGMLEPVAGTSVPADRIDFGEVPRAAAGFTLLAAAQRTGDDSVYSAFAFVDHDVVGVVALLAPNDPAGDLTQWADLDAEWSAAVAAAGPPPQPWGLLGEFRVFEALHGRGTARRDRAMCDLVRRHAPRTGSEPWWAGFDRTEQGFAVWRSSETGELDGVTDLYVLAPVRHEAALDEWAWATDGRHGLRPLARYLVQLAKIRYQGRLYASSEPSRPQMSESDERTTALLRELDSAERRAVPLERVLKTSRLLDKTQFGPQGLLWTITRQRQLGRSLATAVANMRLHAPASRRHGEGVSWTVTDLADAEWLIKQVDEDRLHLEAARERADSVRAAVSVLVERELAGHRNWLTLVQTSILGSILTALTAVQTMNYKVPIRKALESPVIVVVAALALALPLATLRWAGVAPTTSRYRWLDSGVAGLFGAALGWLAVTWWALGRGGGLPTVPWTLSGALVAGLIASVGTHLLTRPR
ncbi:CATRA conflict system CASPASE/TPR repeat-associated protein [Streptomyces sp. NPDC005385]|uniref:CATRA conflict system CASPASE/TPR repeat-associated protein n=1 Tax=Streptomyces sp. NPDC005385 TaxID=3157039 RepID=UPI0033BD3EC9